MFNEPQANQQQINLQVRYDDLTGRYANHVLVSVGNEEVYLDFTSGIVADRPGVSVMPIHTRIAMTPAGVVRLWQLLGQAVKNFQVIQNPAAPGAPTPVEPPPTEPLAGE